MKKVVWKLESNFFPFVVPLYISVPIVRSPSPSARIYPSEEGRREYSSLDVIFPSFAERRLAASLSRLNIHTTISATSPAVTSPNTTMLNTYINELTTSG